MTTKIISLNYLRLLINMRQNGKNNRQRGRGRRNGNGQINRNTTLDSNGPDVRLRGNAQQLYEKYLALANDSSVAGERIQAEAYYQYADHYFRVHSAIVAGSEERRERHQENKQAAEGKSEQTGIGEQQDTASEVDNNVTEAPEEEIVSDAASLDEVKEEDQHVAV